MIQKKITGFLRDFQGCLSELSKKLDHEATLADIEQSILAEFREGARKFMEVVTTRCSRSKEPSRLPCSCKSGMRYQGFRSRTILTTCGPIEVKRSYFYCRKCGKGRLPLDEKWNLGRRTFSPLLLEMICLLAATHSFGESSDILERLIGVRVPETSLEAVAEEEGENLGLTSYLSEIKAEPPLDGDSRLVVQIDGAHVPTVDREDTWKEAKNAVLYVQDRDEKPLHLSHIGVPGRLGLGLRKAAAHLGLRETGNACVVGDGAPWIWNLAGKSFPEATEILDYYHLAEHVHDCSKILFGERSKNGRRWASRLLDAAKEKGGKELIKRLRRGRYCRHKPVRELLRYLSNNRNRIDYPVYRARGLPIGSGKVEAACKRIVTQRLKGCGMRWTVRDAQKIANLRCLYLGPYWNAYWQRRKRVSNSKLTLLRCAA